MIDDEDKSDPTRDAFQNYIAQLTGYSVRLSNERQAAMAYAYRLTGDKKAREELWMQAGRLVLSIFIKMQKEGKLPTVDFDDMDALQEANLAAGYALDKWDPDKGTLSSWLTPAIRGALLNYANTHLNGGIGSKHNRLQRVEWPDGNTEPTDYYDEESDQEAQEFLIEEDRAEEEVFQDELAEAVSGLPTALRWAITLPTAELMNMGWSRSKIRYNRKEALLTLISAKSGYT